VIVEKYELNILSPMFLQTASTKFHPYPSSSSRNETDVDGQRDRTSPLCLDFLRMLI